MSTVLGRIARWILNHKLFSSHSKSDKTKEVSELDYSDELKSDWNQEPTQTEDEYEWEDEEDDWYEDYREKQRPIGPDGHVTYRVIEEFTDNFASSYTEKVLWQGKNVDELSRDYPPSDISDADSLAYREIEEGYVRWHYRIESQLEDGTWQKCEDPRNRDFVTDEFLDWESEIDSENRRRFPGDYMIEAEDDQDDYPYMDYEFNHEDEDYYDEEG